MDRRTDQHIHQNDYWHRIDEQYHSDAAAKREAARRGDGTIESEEAQRAAMLAVKHRRDADALRAENEELRRQLAEVTK